MGFDDRVELAADLYERVALSLNEFFARWVGGWCSGCMELCAQASPEDPIADMELVAGVFPGCCQAGVADDFRGLPDALVDVLRSRRPVAPGPDGVIFTLLERSTGKRRVGRGCIWLDSGGCVLGLYKSVLCLTYLCLPVRERLAGLSGGQQWPLEEDFCGATQVLALIGLAAANGGKSLELAATAVDGLVTRLNRYSAQLG